MSDFENRQFPPLNIRGGNCGSNDCAYIERGELTVKQTFENVAECYAINYPELVVLHNVPYEQEGSAVGVSKGNAELLAGVNAAIAQALADGSMSQFVAEANELATGNILEGLLEG